MTNWLKENQWITSIIVGALIGAGSVMWCHQEILTRHDERIQQNRRDIASISEIRRNLEALNRQVGIIANYVENLRRKESRH